MAESPHPLRERPTVFFPEPLPSLATALGLGLMIGVVRERHAVQWRDAGRPDQAPAAGLRTHALTALAGATAWWSGMSVFAVSLA